jgi:hypothetical protein
MAVLSYLFWGAAFIVLGRIVLMAMTDRSVLEAKIYGARTVCMPIVVVSRHPDDKTVTETANLWRAAIQQSGNRLKPWVIEFPYGGRYVSKHLNGAEYLATDLPWHRYEEICEQVRRDHKNAWLVQLQKHHDPQEINRLISDQQVNPGQSFEWANF